MSESSPGPLIGAAAKVKRAALHLESLHDEVGAFFKSEPKAYSFISKVDVDSSRYRLRVRIHREPPIELSLIVGDFIQNLRAGLDHLVWQLVIANGERKPSGKNAFPIFDDPPPDDPCHPERQRWERMLSGVSEEAIDFIEFCQPYNGPNGPSKHTLSALRRMSNVDKHRTLLASFSAIERVDALEIDVIGVRDVRAVKTGQLYIGRPLEDGDLVLEAAVTITGPNPEVKLQAELPMDIGFGRKAVPLEGLRNMVHTTAEIVAASREFV